MAPRHAAKASRRRHVPLLVGGCVLVLAGAAVAAVALIPTTIAAPPAGAAVHGPLLVRSITPSGANVSPDAPLRVQFNNPLAASSPMPTITPKVPGTWAHLSANEVSFRPAVAFSPGTTYHVIVPTSTVASDGVTLHVAAQRTFSITLGSTLRLNQILAQLGYLPLRFVPTGPIHATSVATQRGTFTWRWHSVPLQLTQLWQPNTFTVITKGALMAFENDNNLPTDGVASAAVWTALLHALATGKVDHSTYNYVDVSTDLPETLTLYVNMKQIYTSLVNTGISARPTALATNPVYLRYTVTTMSGTNPDGSHYDDPGIPWVSYFSGGEALHGYIRSSYGWPQSLGCVEMPFAHAGAVFPYTPIGTLVTVH